MKKRTCRIVHFPVQEEHKLKINESPKNKEILIPSQKQLNMVTVLPIVKCAWINRQRLGKGSRNIGITKKVETLQAK